MINSVERQVALTGLKTEDDKIQNGFFAAILLSWIGFSVSLLACVMWVAEFLSDDHFSPFNPFLWVSLPGMAISSVSIWLSRAMARRAVKWRAARNEFWDTYGYRCSDWP